MGGTPAEAKTNLGFAYERRGDMANAYEQYLEAARLDPHSRRARLNLAHAAALTGHPVPAGEHALPKPIFRNPSQRGHLRGVARRGVGPMKTKAPMHVPTDQLHAGCPSLRDAVAVLLLATAGLAGGGGCADRTYLTKSHGRAYAEAFDRQVVNPTPPPRPTRGPAHAEAIEGLDSQEASAVSRSYRHSLSGKEAVSETNGQNMVITTIPAPLHRPGTCPRPPCPTASKERTRRSSRGDTTPQVSLTGERPDQASC